MQKIKGWSAVLIALLAANVAFGQEPQNAEPAKNLAQNFDREVARGIELYRHGDYNAAIQAFQAAFQLKGDAKLIYNVARCQEKLGQIDEAIVSYQRFVDMPGTTAQERAKGLESIKALRDEKQAREEIAATDAKQAREAKKARLEAIEEAPPLYDLTGTSNAFTAPVEPPETHSRTAEWVMIGTGTAALIVGGVFGGLALKERNAFDESRVLDDKLDHRQIGERNALIGDVTAGAGAAVLITGALFLLFGD